MKAQEFIQQKLASFGYEVSTDMLGVYLAVAGLDGQTEAAANFTSVKGVLLNLIPELLALPDVSEGDLSIKRDPVRLTKYLQTLRAELGQDDPLAAKPVIRNISNRW